MKMRNSANNLKGTTNSYKTFYKMKYKVAVFDDTIKSA